MRNKCVNILFSLLVLVLGASAEELLPKLCGVGFPILLTVVQHQALRRGILSMILFAVAAGALEDSLSGLPYMTSVSYFLAVGVLVRWSGLPRGAVLLSYPLYQLWLGIWVRGLVGEIFQRLLLSVPLGVVTAIATVGILTWAERTVAVDGRG